MVRRRSILAAVGLTASGVVGRVGAHPGRRPLSARAAGVGDTVATMLLEGDVDGATELLEANNVTHTVSGGQVDHSLGPDVQDPSIESRYSESESSVYCTLVHLDRDRWLATGVASLRGRRYRLRDAAMVPDICGLSYDAYEWVSPDPTADNLVLTASEHDIEYETYSPNYGPAASVHLTYGQYPDAVIGMQTELIRRGAHPHVPVTFEYEHTYAYVNDYLELISVSVGGSGLSVSLPAGAYRAWLHEEATAPATGHRTRW